MDKVWVLVEYSFGEQEIVGVYSSEEEAKVAQERIADKHNEKYERVEIEEHVVEHDGKARSANG